MPWLSLFVVAFAVDYCIMNIRICLLCRWVIRTSQGSWPLPVRFV